MRWRRRRGEGWDQHRYWALDLEMGGLDPSQHDILSVGMVPIVGGAIRLGDAYHSHVRPTRRPTVDSIGIHGLLQNDVEGAPDLETVFMEIDKRFQGSVLVVHFASVDIPFLRVAYQRLGIAWPDIPIVDTVQLLTRSNRRFGGHNVRADLAMARVDLGLPPHDHHEALADAIATAELFLVLAHRLKARSLNRLL